MTQYAAGFYRVCDPFDEDTIGHVLNTLDQLDMGFWPMAFSSSREEKIILTQPSDYTRSILPQWCYINSQDVTLTFDAANGTEVTFTESSRPKIIPASLLITFSGEVLEANRWEAAILTRLFRVLVKTLGPDYAHIVDRAHLLRQSYDDAMFDFDARKVPAGLFWFNYYSGGWVQNIGDQVLKTLLTELPVVEWLENGGVLFAIQVEPYREESDRHRANQIRLEGEFGLQRIHGRFPRTSM